jgi:hypothetical protein
LLSSSATKKTSLITSTPEPSVDDAKTDVKENVADADADVNVDNVVKRSTARKKRKSKSKKPKHSGDPDDTGSGKFGAEEPPDFFPDPNLRLALESLRVSTRV